MTGYSMLGRLTATLVLGGAWSRAAHAADRPTSGLADAPSATAPATPAAPPPVGVAGLVAEAPLRAAAFRSPLFPRRPPVRRAVGATCCCKEVAAARHGLRYYGVDALGSGAGRLRRGRAGDQPRRLRALRRRRAGEHDGRTAGAAFDRARARWGGRRRLLRRADVRRNPWADVFGRSPIRWGCRRPPALESVRLRSGQPTDLY